ncbi:unnamed protein product [Litomosoides sigmodontis]|uniref:FH2 domain-containing protein n=1 Tax=Litomosoides sigmodontis TaxID=42156 RepID=A0A3P6S9I7_LITSI|nr:unnamed protein product [Litomosoides sigmodontis]
MEKDRARKKCAAANVAEGKRSVRNDRTAAVNEITEGRGEQSANEFYDDNLSDEADVLRFLLAKISAGNSDRGIWEAAKLRHHEKHSSPSRPNCAGNSSHEDGKGNFPHERRSQGRNLSRSNSKSNLIEMHGEAKSIEASGTVDDNPKSETETINHEVDNSPDIHDKSTSNVAESPVAEHLRATDRDQLLNSVNQSSDNPDRELVERNTNLDVIDNKTEINQNSKTGIIIDTTKIEADIEISGFTTGSENVDTGSSRVKEEIEQTELQETGNGSIWIEFATSSDEMNLSEFRSTKSLQETDNSLISGEAMKSAGDPGVRSEMISETLAADAIQKSSFPKISTKNGAQTDSGESVTTTWQRRSAEQCEDVENLPSDESKITCGIDLLLKNTEESHSGEAAKNKFYEAIAGFWKHTGFSKKHPDTAGQPENLSSDFKHIPSTHSSKTSLIAESLGTLIPFTEFTKSSEISSKPTAQVTAPCSEADIISSLQENTATDVASTSCHPSDDQSLRHSPNASITEHFTSKALPLVTSDSSAITDEVIRDADGLMDKMEETKKCKKGKSESSNLSVFGHKIDSIMFGSKKCKGKDNGSLRSFRPENGHHCHVLSGLSVRSLPEADCANLPETSRRLMEPNHYEVNRMNDDQVNAAFAELLKQMNIKDEKFRTLLADNDMEKKRQMVCQSQRLNMATQENSKRPIDLIRRIERMLASGEECRLMKDVLKDLKVQLSVQKVDWIKEFGNQGGLQLLFYIMRKLIESLRLSENSEREEEYALQLHDSVKCLKSIVNTWPGMELCFRRKSKMFSCLVAVLSVASGKPSLDHWDSLKFVTVSLLGVVTFVNDDKFELKGRETLLQALTEEARLRKCDRFRCIVSCLSKSNRLDVVKKAMTLVNVVLDVPEPYDTTTEEGRASAEAAWQIRMHWRSEFMRAGMYDCVQFLESCTLEAVKKQYDNFCRIKEADFAELVNRFEQIKGEYEEPDCCYNILLAGVKNTRAEGPFLSILQHLLLVTDDINVRTEYFRLIENCISEIVLPKTCVDPDFRGKFEFTQDITHFIDALEDCEEGRQASERVETATQAKNEALAKLSQYYRRMEEFANESEQLRNHIKDPSVPLPPPTNRLPPPDMYAETTDKNTLPAVIRSDAPPPAHQSAPPPPPPPPPPILSSGSYRPPPPPPPPLPGGQGSFGLPLPPPSGLLNKVVSPDLPEYLKKKPRREVDVPMKKIPWSSATIKPKEISKDSFWAQTAEEKFANERLFETLKKKFAANRQSICDSDSAKSGRSLPKKKVRKPLVIQDEKILQSLAILQGSQKIPLDEWKRILLEIDDRVISSGTMQQLRNALPPSDTLKKLEDLGGNKFNEMPEGEQFAVTLASIKGLPARLDSMIFMLEFDKTINDLKPTISAVIEACDEIRTSRGFKMFLEMVLLVGNYMGHSSKTYKDIFGFEMSVLKKLSDTKDVNNSESLLHYLISCMSTEANGLYANFPKDEFLHVDKASRVNADEVAKGVTALKNALSKVENQLKTFIKQAENDLFSEKMGPFLSKAKAECEIVEKMYNTMNTKWESLRKYYSFDSKKYNMETFFSDLKLFKEDYEKVIHEMEKMREIKEREEERKKRLPLKPLQPGVAASPLNRTVAIEGILKTGKQDLGVVDEIEKILEAGYLEGAERRTPRRTPRTRAGRAAMERQRSRTSEEHMSISSCGASRLPTQYRIRRKGQPTLLIQADAVPILPKENEKP